MSSSILRQLWSLIEATQTSTLMSLDDTKLVESLMQQLEEQRLLNREETNCVSVYIRSRILLIRELAQARLVTDPLG